MFLNKYSCSVYLVAWSPFFWNDPIVRRQSLSKAEEFQRGARFRIESGNIMIIIVVTPYRHDDDHDSHLSLRPEHLLRR